MADVHGRLTDLYIDDTSDTCRQIRGDLNSITFNRSKNNPESTTFGDDTTQRLADGLRDASIDFSGIFATTGLTSAVVGLLDQLYLSGCITRIQYFPAGSVSGSPVYTSCMVMSAYSQNSPVDGIATVTATFQIASGSITAACVA
mgnify:CR=1 FL=1